jgi:hypothetical protein
MSKKTKKNQSVFAARIKELKKIYKSPGNKLSWQELLQKKF